MDLRFLSHDLQRLCNRHRAMTARWGAERAAQVAQRLQELDAVDQLGDLELLPYIRVVPGEGANELLVDDGNGIRIRLVVEPERNPEGEDPTWRLCSAAAIVEVVIEGTDQ